MTRHWHDSCYLPLLIFSLFALSAITRCKPRFPGRSYKPHAKARRKADTHQLGKQRHESEPTTDVRIPMNQSNHPVSLTDLSEKQDESLVRFRKVADHCHGHKRSAQRPHANLTQPNIPKNSQTPSPQSRDLRSTSGSQDNHSSFFNLSPIEDALLRETFSGRFTL